MPNCPFCSPVVLRNDLAYARLDKNPVNEGHLLVLPSRHVPTWFDATPAERAALLSLVDEGKQLLDQRNAPDGYTWHQHWRGCRPDSHAPARASDPALPGDTPNPQGGVRGVIPQRQSYPGEDMP